MKIQGYNWSSLNRHGVTPEMINEVIDGSMISYFYLEDEDETCEMLVGYTFNERLLEIGLRYLNPDLVYVFHAQNVSPQYRKLFEKEWKNG